MEFVVYILFSERLGKYYVGQTSDLDKRLKRHNSGRERFTRCVLCKL
ncbi:GIY-YIG nuclease family protein [Algoriphagus sp. NBT04N3]|nr:GIY-YIG nuclease family protein [Algoriphagus sp. NBT04N3]QYH39290.1 GIY-YIG nuclease family protein [Algoriphagus sp. NBT04N3]